MSPGRRVVHALLSFATLALAARYFQKPTDLPAIGYDFIVIGGGTAGAVVASRLGESQNRNILIIEAGLSNEDVFEVQVPGFLNKVGFETIVDWNYTTVPQSNLNHRTFPYPRAKILGGCSSHNAMVYTRGSRDDYDRWAATTGDNNLSWDKILSYILKAEKWSSPNDPDFPEEGHFDPRFHSENGKLGVTAPYFNHPFNDLIFEATKELHDEFPLLKDLNDGRPIGLGWSQATVAHGLRSSSATAYLTHAGDNVHVLLHSLVTRVLPVDHDGSQGSTSHTNDFRKVEVATGSNTDPTFTVTAKEEVVLSGGVFGTPQLLLLSGIGPQPELEALGIRSIIDNPSVGGNFSDQLAISIRYSTDLSVTSFDETAALNQWKLNHTGPLARTPFLSLVGWIRFPPDSAPFRDGSRDPTGGANSPHVELGFDGISTDSGGNLTLSMTLINLNPTSRGSIRLATASPFDQPIINPALMTSSLDSAILLEGFRSVQRLLRSETFSKHIFGLKAPIPSADGNVTDDEFIQYLKENGGQFGHGTGSCKMAPHGASWGVVDPEFKVRGVKGLRIVDASVIPFVPSGHIQAAVYAIAEWGAELIKRSH